MRAALGLVAFRLLELVTPAADRDALLGDLLEEAGERGGLARESLRAIAPVLGLRVRRAGGARVLAFALLAGALAESAVLLATMALWRHVLFLVPLRAAAAAPLEWWCVSLLPATLAGALAARLARRLAALLLGGRS